MRKMNKISAILATGRISNLPTVWSNLLVAFLFAGSLTTANLTLFALACLSASLLYVGGCFLGDAIDVEFDLTHKPERPIPSGILERKSVFTALYSVPSCDSQPASSPIHSGTKNLHYSAFP